jgi:acyl-CoA synthetase (AMP-forming)/AMP-acid ligase II
MSSSAGPLRPFDESGVERDPGGEAVVELGGPRLGFRQLWDAAARVAGGLRADGVGRGDRVASGWATARTGW